MNIEHLTLCVRKPSVDAAAAIIGALTAKTPTPLVCSITCPRTVHQTTLAPPIGQAWPGVAGIYAGIAKGAIGEADAHLVLLDAKPEGELTWAAATAWVTALGNGAHLPTRDESALLYAHLRDSFESSYWYWTGSQCSESYAWVQFFGNGFQDYFGKKYEGRARAVRRFPL